MSPETCKGQLDQTEVVTLPSEQKEEIKNIETTRGQSVSTEEYTKPELYKLISLRDFEKVAQKTLTQKAWAFYSSAATDLLTHNANSNLYRRIMLRPRVMRDVAEVNTRRSILGIPSSAPFFVSPAAMARLAHPDGELALARGCASEGLIQCVSSPRSASRRPTGANVKTSRSQITHHTHLPPSRPPAQPTNHSSSNSTSTPTAPKQPSSSTAPTLSVSAPSS